MGGTGAPLRCGPTGGGSAMVRRTYRPTASFAAATLLLSLAIWATGGPASATNCTTGLQPVLTLSQTVLQPTSTNPNVGYDELVTNTGTCGATNVTVTVTLPATSSFVSFSSVNRSWACTGVKTVTCLLGSQLDQTSSGGTNGNSGRAEVIVYATPATGSKNSPPDATEFAKVTDPGQSAVFNPTTQVAWGSVINPKTGGNLHIDSTTTLIDGESALVNIPPGVSAVVNLGQLAPDSGPNCPLPAPYANGCNADLSINAPVISKGYTTITLTFAGATQPPPPLWNEDNSTTGPQPLQKCKGQTASPPCLDSFALNSAGTAWILVIHDAGGTKYYG
jgi:uncharacterized repeat protein (TIGR01451 family)